MLARHFFQLGFFFGACRASWRKAARVKATPFGYLQSNSDLAGNDILFPFYSGMGG